MNRILKTIAPVTFNHGITQCNELGKKLVRNRPVKRFLDIGCGNGQLTMEFASMCKATEVYGIEVDDDMIALGVKQGITCHKCDLNTTWSFDSNYFDLILSSQNIEHIYNTRHYLEECYRCLAPGGQLIILTENLASWINIFSLLLGWQPFSTTNICGWNIGNPLIWHKDEEKKDQYIGGISPGSHIRVLAYKGLIDMLLAVGFISVEVFTKGYLPFWGKLSDFLCYIDKRHGHFLVGSAVK